MRGTNFCTVYRRFAGWGATKTRVQMMKSLFGGGLLDGPAGNPSASWASSAADATVSKKTTLPASAAAAIAAATALKSSSSPSASMHARDTSDDPKTASVEWDFDDTGLIPHQSLDVGGSGGAAGSGLGNLDIFCSVGHGEEEEEGEGKRQGDPGAESPPSTEAVTPKARGGSGRLMWGVEAGENGGTWDGGGSIARDPPPLVERQRRCCDGKEALPQGCGGLRMIRRPM